MVAGDGADKTTYVTSQTIYAPLNGGFMPCDACNINDNNYFKLRDLGELFGFEVDWDETNNCVIIDSTKNFTED